MKLMTNQVLAGNGLFKLKGNDWLVKQRVAGKACASALNILERAVKSKTDMTLLELSMVAEEIIRAQGCTPTFKGYKGFPAAVCISVNHDLVHGIPTNYKLKEGDVVKFDLGATFEGAIADTAITCIFGEPKSNMHVKMIEECEKSLMEGIRAIAVGKRLGVIGHAIHRSAKQNTNFGLIVNYGGHGISWDQPHAPPFVSNKDSPDNGFRIQSGLVLAIEPMLVFGSTETFIDKDGWTVRGTGISSHFEHSVFVHEDHVEIITDRSSL